MDLRDGYYRLENLRNERLGTVVDVIFTPPEVRRKLRCLFFLRRLSIAIILAFLAGTVLYDAGFFRVFFLTFVPVSLIFELLGMYKRNRDEIESRRIMLRPLENGAGKVNVKTLLKMGQYDFLEVSGNKHVLLFKGRYISI